MSLYKRIGEALANSREHGEEPDVILLHREAHETLVKEMKGIELNTYMELSTLYAIPCAVDCWGDVVNVGQGWIFMQTLRRY